MATIRRALAGVLLATACGCTRYKIEPALVVLRSDTAKLTVPDSVNTGESFTVSVGVFGGGCTREHARPIVRVRGDTAEIRPRMRRMVSDSCTANLLILSQEVPVRFAAPGVALVRVVGVLKGPPSDSSSQIYTRPVVLERRVRVVPPPR